MCSTDGASITTVYIRFCMLKGADTTSLVFPEITKGRLVLSNKRGLLFVCSDGF